MKKPGKKKFVLCKACKFIRTFGFSRRPHELDLTTFVIALFVALMIAGMIRLAIAIIITASLYARHVQTRERRQKLLDLAKNGAPQLGAPSFFDDEINSPNQESFTNT